MRCLIVSKATSFLFLPSTANFVPNIPSQFLLTFHVDNLILLVEVIKKEIFHICDQSFRHSRVCDNFIIFVIIIWVQEATRNGLSRRSSAFASIMSKLACKHSYYFSTSLLFPSWRLPFFNQEAHGWPSIAINKL